VSIDAQRARDVARARHRERASTCAVTRRRVIAMMDAFGALVRASWAPIARGALDGVELNDVDVLVVAECAAFAAWCLLGSWVWKTYSFVDQLWSVTPVVYVATYAYHGVGTAARARLTLMLGLALLWGARLTYNFARKGGYAGEEDYRWGELRKNKLLRNPIVWQLFNVSFIAVYQNVLLLLIALPAAVAYRSKEALAWRGADGVALCAWTAAFLVEVAADEQQWRFQRSKRGLARKVKGWKEDYERGFLTHALFAWSRHPNFWAEQTMWVSFSGFAAASLKSKAFFTPALIGPILLILLFQGSTSFTEAITGKNYPDYKAYQDATSRLLPLPRRRALPPPTKKD
jgi:steroid 5-alpha reductase family enzyme